MSFQVDLDLLRKYDRPGPRYTSYPTAPHFHTEILVDDFIAHLKTEHALQTSQGISLYFHIPFCDSLCWFCGCNTSVTQDRQKIARYLDYLEREMDLIRPLLSPQTRVVQMHWGGGTPTHLQPQEILRLGKAIRNHFDIHPDAELGVEIDPRALSEEHVQALAQVGFRRCSLGVQDFDFRVQKAVNRVQPFAMTQQTVQWLREAGFDSLNLDLMYGLPHQTLETFQETLDQTLELNPDRLAVFSFAYLPELKKHQRLIQRKDLPDPEMKLGLLQQGIQVLSEAGYQYIGMDHFAKPDDELSLALQNGSLYRNFQGYSTHAGVPVVAMGVTAIGQTSQWYVQNTRTLDDYYRLIDAHRLPVLRGVQLSFEDQLRRQVITQLMCQMKLRYLDYADQYGIDFQRYFASSLQKLQELAKDQLVVLHSEGIEVSEQGRLFVRNIAMCFDAYLDTTDSFFSRTV